MGVGARRHAALHRLADRPVLPVDHVPEVAGVATGRSRPTPPRRRRTAAGTRSRSGRRPAGAARTRRRGRPSTTASGSGRPARPCGAPARPRSARAAVTAVGGARHRERPRALAVRDARRPSRAPGRRRRTTAPAATARGAPGRSGSTRCSSRRRPSSWPRPRRCRSGPVTSDAEVVVGQRPGRPADAVAQRRGARRASGARRRSRPRPRRRAGAARTPPARRRRPRCAARAAASRRGRRSTSGRGSGSTSRRTAAARCPARSGRAASRGGGTRCTPRAGRRPASAVSTHRLAEHVDDGHPLRLVEPEVGDPADAGPLAQQHPLALARARRRVDVQLARQRRLQGHRGASVAGEPRTRWHAHRCPSGSDGQDRQRRAAAQVGHRVRLARGQRRAARVEAAARRDPGRVGDLAAQHDRLEPLHLRYDGQQRLRVGVLGRGQHLLGRPGLDDPAEVHHRDPVGDVPGQPEVVGDHEDAEAELLAQLEQQRQDLAADRRVEAGDRLVGDQQLRLEGQRAGDQHALPLAAGQLVRVAQEQRLGRPQPGRRQRGGDQLGLARARLR